MVLSHFPWLALAAGVAFASAAFAQQTRDPNGAVPVATPTGPTGTLQQTHGDWRSAQLVGANVYNDKNVSIGTIDNLLVNSDGKIDRAIISVGGFLGVGAKLVAVPFDQLKFEKSRSIVTAAPPGTPPPGAATNSSIGGSPSPPTGPASVPPRVTAAAPVQSGYFSIVLPSATKDLLASMPESNYDGS